MRQRPPAAGPTMSAAPSNSTSPRASAAPNFAALPATIAAAASGRPDSPNMAHQLPAGVTQGAAAPTPTQAAAAAAASHASAYRPQPQHGRLRARSIGKPAAAPAPLPQADSSELRQSPSRAGSGAPGGVLNAAAHAAGFARPSLNAQGRASSDGAFALASLARQRAAELDARRVTFSERAHELGGGGAGSAHETETGGTEESGSTQSDSPPHTPRDSYYHYSHDTDPRLSGSGDEEDEYWVEPPSRRGSSAIKEEREAWRTGGEAHGLYDPALLTRSAEMPTRALPPMEPVPRADDATSTDPAAATRNRSKSLEGLTRMSLRRGKSFTSLLVQPMPAAAPSPASSSAGLAEQRDPFLSGAADRAKLSAIAPTPVLAQFENPPILRPDSLGNLPDPRNLFPPATASLDPLATPKSLRDFVPQLLILFALFLSSFVVIALTIATLPGLFLPHSVSDLPALTKTLTTYRASSFTAEAHLFVVLTLLFLWKQCFSIPGSILTNILFGALYGTTLGTWWACLWTATGSTGAYLIAVVIAPLVSMQCFFVDSPTSSDLAPHPQVEYYFAKPLDVTRRALKLAPPSAAPSAPGLAQADVAPPSDSDLFSHLLLARFFPLLPYSVLNVSFEFSVLCLCHLNPDPFSPRSLPACCTCRSGPSFRPS